MELFSGKQHYDVIFTDKNIKTEFIAEKTELVMQK